MLVPKNDPPATASGPATPEFVPTHYLRLVKRASQILHGVVEYTLTEEGIENPKCTICPVMLHLPKPDLKAVVYVQYDEKVYKGHPLRWSTDNVLVLTVPIGAEPVG